MQSKDPLSQAIWGEGKSIARKTVCVCGMDLRLEAVYSVRGSVEHGLLFVYVIRITERLVIPPSATFGLCAM